MPELAPARVSVVLCAASEEALDRLVAPGFGARPIRTAPDESLFVAAQDVGGDVHREVADRVAALDADALTADVTDAWAAWELRGPDARAALLRVSRLEVPDDGWVQGDVAGLAAKVVGGSGGLLVLVPASVGEHLRARLASTRTEVPA